MQQTTGSRVVAMPAPLAGTWPWMLLTLQVMIACITFCSFTARFTALELFLYLGSLTDSGNDTC